MDIIPPGTMNALRQHRWPGNIRELGNVIERAVIFSRGLTLRVSHQDLKTRLAPGQGADRMEALEEVERNHILKALKETC